ncbi:hypothetical protein [Polaromonas vacuolata]|uniref:hypothetical protein n=1 Tax=Polaromonas vacuolata TaxID=37448 RepID=UPI001457089B|nr:hypothetical protein [Polaromonas vacuolata]
MRKSSAVCRIIFHWLTLVFIAIFYATTAVVAGVAKINLDRTITFGVVVDNADLYAEDAAIDFE